MSSFVIGDWNATCFECGRQDKASRLVRHWKGYYVHPEHNEPRHPQEFVRGQPEHVAADWVQKPSVRYDYQDRTAGYGDGFVTLFQAGSGLYPITLTEVTVAGLPRPYSVTALGLISFSNAPAKGEPVRYSGQEVVPC